MGLFAKLTLGVAGGILFALALPAGGQEPDARGKDRVAELERRVQELEDLVRRLKSDTIAPPTPSPASTPAPNAPHLPPIPPVDLPMSKRNPAMLLTPTADAAPEKIAVSPVPVAEGEVPAKELSKEPRAPIAGWNNGFFLQSPDKAHVLRITGQIQADYRNFVDTADTTDIDTFLARRVRFGLEATVANYYEFRLLPDFGMGKSVIQDAYLNVHYWDAWQFQVGKFKEPFSYEQLIQDRFVPTLERSIIDQLVPARDVGAMMHGQKLFGDRIDYAAGIFNGEINGDTDTNSGLDFAGRLAGRPFRGLDEDSLLYNFQIGISGTVGWEQEPANPNRLRTPATVPWFKYGSAVTADGQRSRYSPEVSWFYRSLGFMAQYFHEEQEFHPTATSPEAVNVRYEGYQVLVSWLVTGEERTTYSQAITPRVDFDLRNPFVCHGALELVARASRLQASSDVFPALADPLGNCRGATELTLGFNWYWNRWVRWQFNWEHAWFDDPVRLGSGDSAFLRRQDTLLARFQVIF